MKAGGYYISAAVDANRADLVSRNLPALEAMLRSAVVGDPSATGAPGPVAAAAATSGSGNSHPQQSTATGAGTLGEYVYAVPRGWTPNQYPDGIVLSAPRMPTENCIISMWPMRPTSNNLYGDANTAFRQIFNTYELRNRSSDGLQVPQTVIRGTSGQGWDYLILKQGIGKPNTPQGSWETLLGFVMVAKLDSRIAVISGLSKLPLVSNCFGELQTNVWPDFFYSLRFRSWNSTDQSSVMKQRLAGTWTIATATAADQYTFAANGRFGTGAAAQQYHLLNNQEVLTTTQGYFGNGAYTLDQNTITLKQDDRGPETAHFRVEQESKDGGHTWADVLDLLRISTVDGKEYEVRYSKK
jgi:hypothetical protein